MGFLNSAFDTYASPLFHGLLLTVLIFVGGLVAATIVGSGLGIARYSSFGFVRIVATGIVEFFRGTSAIVQLYWVFYALPLLLGGSVSPLVAGWAVIGLNQGAYFSEVVRGALRAVPTHQKEASVALNFSGITTWRRVLIPQALPVAMPSYTNIVVTVLKETPIVSLIGLADMTYVANTLRNAHGHSTLLFAILAVVYLLIALALARLGKTAESAVNVRRKTRYTTPARADAAARTNVSAPRGEDEVGEL